MEGQLPSSSQLSLPNRIDENLPPSATDVAHSALTDTANEKPSRKGGLL
jgi:hypothetical protein